MYATQSLGHHAGMAFIARDRVMGSTPDPKTSPKPVSDDVLPSGGRRVLILVGHLPCPFDRRVWQEAGALRDAGYRVSIVCPTGRGFEKRFEIIDRIHIYRYRLPMKVESVPGYTLEYAIALFRSFVLSCRICFTRGFDVIHASNPPDLFFLIGGFFKLFGKKFLFDHRDINPERYEARFGRRDFFHRLMLKLERWSFRTADVSIASNESCRRIAIERGDMMPERVFVVRSSPNLERLRIGPGDHRLKCGRHYLVGYVGAIGTPEGIDYLLDAVRHIVFDLGRRDIHFGLVGGGASLEKMKELAVTLGVADYVTFTGRLGDEDMLRMLNTADVCVNADVANAMNDQSTNNTIMEYMALGKPIVQFDLAEGRFSAQEASLYAERNDSTDLAIKLITLLDNPLLRERMGMLGRRRVVNELAWKHEVPKLLAAYRMLWQGQEDDERAGSMAAP